MSLIGNTVSGAMYYPSHRVVHYAMLEVHDIEGISINDPVHLENEVILCL